MALSHLTLERREGISEEPGCLPSPTLGEPCLGSGLAEQVSVRVEGGPEGPVQSFRGLPSARQGQHVLQCGAASVILRRL